MVRTFRDLQNDDDHGDDDHGDQDPQQDFFAGGEKSGLAVQDPNRRPQDHFRNIMQQAREYVYLRLHFRLLGTLAISQLIHHQKSRSSRR